MPYAVVRRSTGRGNVSQPQVGMSTGSVPGPDCGAGFGRAGCTMAGTLVYSLSCHPCPYTLGKERVKIIVGMDNLVLADD